MLRRRSPKTKVPRLERPTYERRHDGRTLLVLGNGPSLGTHRAELLEFGRKHAAIMLGANNIAPFTHPDYHAFTNRKRFLQYASTVNRARSRVLVGAYLPDELVRLHVPGDAERLMYVNDHDAHFDVLDGVIQASCRTVSVLLIGVAAVMGARDIFVAGLDGFRQDEPGRGYHAETPVLKPDEALQHDVQAHMFRFLDEIQDWLRAHDRPPFTILTPTVYERHYRPELLRSAP